MTWAVEQLVRLVEHDYISTTKLLGRPSTPRARFSLLAELPKKGSLRDESQ